MDAGQQTGDTGGGILPALAKSREFSSSITSDPEVKTWARRRRRTKTRGNSGCSVVYSLIQYHPRCNRDTEVSPYRYIRLSANGYIPYSKFYFLSHRANRNERLLRKSPHFFRVFWQTASSFPPVFEEVLRKRRSTNRLFSLGFSFFNWLNIVIAQIHME